MTNPKISIIIPTYNAQDFIANALKSCINQTFEDIEILVVNDCTQDKSIEIAKEFANTDKRIRIIHNTSNQGTFLTRNNGVLQAHSDIIMFLDPDDTLSEKACELVFNSFYEENIELVFFNFLRNTKENFITRKALMKKEEFYLYYCKKGATNAINSLCTKAYKRKIYLLNLEENIQCEKKICMAEDLFVVASYFSYIQKIALLDECIYIYNINENSITTTTDSSKIAQNIKDIYFIMEKLALLCLQKDSLYSLFVQCCIYNIHIHAIDLKCKITNNFIQLLMLKFLRKKIKSKKKIAIKKILRQSNVPSRF
ncbi:glycosyltransferase family 2 protein [Campylobacter sp. MIT 21-1685]|uniref:glycosyltransferase family 2 protein n=1 Tax=unclassified Campylobacter TaxID=2593542 RepID=UPI00224B3D35|nr:MULTISPECIES: glycosyltransferase family 2 protein [unclassified Campylobacter]MCX2683697.1 glycosyltransferase family 2 protein [Campylobacter sp. MIT 21-1684]MCX2751982.1 glycosyltransferase family 2 protein [Campylobacter sp. MIT 21-1682]MCX2808157.1 glycosyltransferase family 2 protein [Campylobacter sp. MIT 21-1685]